MNSEATDDEIRTALTEAEEHAAKKCPRGEIAEAVRDAASDAVVWCAKNYKRSHGPFPNYAGAAVAKFVRRAILKFRRAEKTRPVMGSLPEHDLPAKTLPSAGRVPMTPELADLPDDLRDVVRLYMIDGYTMEEIGLLIGVSEATVRTRLTLAALELNPGVQPRTRGKWERRLAKG